MLSIRNHGSCVITKEELKDLRKDANGLQKKIESKCLMDCKSIKQFEGSKHRHPLF